MIIKKLLKKMVKIKTTWWWRDDDDDDNDNNNNNNWEDFLHTRLLIPHVILRLNMNDHQNHMQQRFPKSYK